MNKIPEFQTLDVTVDGRVCHVRLNRPHKHNALDGEVRRDLHQILTWLEEHSEIGVLVISGRGHGFSAGADLDATLLDAAAPLTWTERRHAFGAWQRLLEQLERIPQVTIASIHGHCIGGGAVLAIACDLRIGTSDIDVRIPELAVGVPLTWAGVPRLIRELGMPVARDLVLTERPIDAKAALEVGFIQRLVDPSDLEEATNSVIADLLATPPGALAITRSMFAAIGRDQLGPTAWADADLLSWSLTEPESQKASAAYLQERTKRPNRGSA